MQPDGQPAVNATVLLCTPLAGATIEGPAHLVPGLNTTTYRTQTDEAGKFFLKAALDPQGLIIVHDQGYAELAPGDLPSGGTVTLQAWGTVRGKVVLDGRPMANDHVIISGQTARYTATGRRFGFLTFSLETDTDAEGKFCFEKAPAGDWKAGRKFKVADRMFASHQSRVSVQSGATTEVVLGGTGRAVTGKLILPAGQASVDWQLVPVQILSKLGSEYQARPRREDFETLEAYETATENFFQGYQNQPKFTAICGADGSFRVADVPPGTYELKIQVWDPSETSLAPRDPMHPSRVACALSRELTVPDDGNTEPVDLGVLDLESEKKVASTQ